MTYRHAANLNLRAEQGTVPAHQAVAGEELVRLRHTAEAAGDIADARDAELVAVVQEALNRNHFNGYTWKPALKAARVPAARANGFHALRHHFASVLLHNGVDIRALADYLGHEDPGFTLRIYTHLMPGAADRMRAAVDRVLSGAADGPVTAQEGAL